MKDNKKTSKQVIKETKPYETAKVDIVPFNEDVILASSYTTKGTYDDEWEWKWN